MALGLLLKGKLKQEGTVILLESKMNGIKIKGLFHADQRYNGV